VECFYGEGNELLTNRSDASPQDFVDFPQTNKLRLLWNYCLHIVLKALFKVVFIIIVTFLIFWVNNLEYLLVKEFLF